ncbi:MAG TPA: methionine biosynthesis protein MetW, partial [Caulobacter sp.]|nr:methionine biosynthesis protein MetW [Caulobacter sp.]
WWATPNIHLCTLADFLALTEDLGVRIDACAAFAGTGPARQIDPTKAIENWRAESCLFMLSRNPPPVQSVTRTEPPATSGDLFDG